MYTVYNVVCVYISFALHLGIVHQVRILKHDIPETKVKVCKIVQCYYSEVYIHKGPRGHVCVRVSAHRGGPHGDVYVWHAVCNRT